MSERIRVDIGRAPIIFGPFVVLFKDLVQHFMIVGTTGSGKSIVFFMLMMQLLYRIGHALFPDHRAVIYDAKGDALDLIAQCGATCPVYDLNPFRSGSVGIDLAADITDEADAHETSVDLVPDDNSAGKDAHYFTEAVRVHIETCIKVLMRRAPKKWTLRDLCVILLSEKATKKAFELYPDTKAVYEDFAYAKEYPSVRSTIRTKLTALSYIAAAWHASKKNPVSLRSWIDESAILVLGSSLRHKHTLEALNRLIIRNLSNMILDQPKSFQRRIFLFLDELVKFGFPDGLNEFLTEGRDRGVCGFTGFQSYQGLCSKRSLGKELADELLGQCGHAAFLRMGTDRATAEWAAKIVGEHFEYVVSQGGSTTEIPPDKDKGKDEKSKRQFTDSNNRSVEKRFVLPPEFLMDEPIPSPETALGGVYVAPGASPTLYEIPGDTLFRDILPKKSESKLKTGGPRPPSDYVLVRWDAGDLKRLNLEGIFQVSEDDDPDIDDIGRLEIDPE